MAEDVLERLRLPAARTAQGADRGRPGREAGRKRCHGGAEVVEPEELDEEAPYPFGGFDFIASLARLDTVNDLPGALIHVRNALVPGGLAIASFLGAGSLPQLRRIMLAADAERPAPARLHPMVDVRAGAQLLQRTGWADPVADCHTVRVAYRSLERLVGDLRAQGLGNVLASSRPPLGRGSAGAGRACLPSSAGDDGRVVETFEIVTLARSPRVVPPAPPRGGRWGRGRARRRRNRGPTCLAECDARRVTAVLAADAELDVRARAARPRSAASTDQLPDTVDVEADERDRAGRCPSRRRPAGNATHRRGKRRAWSASGRWFRS